MDIRIYDIWLLTVTVIESIAIIVTNGFMVITFARNAKLLSAMNCYICSMCFSGLVTGLLVPLGFGPFIGYATQFFLLKQVLFPSHSSSLFSLLTFPLIMEAVQILSVLYMKPNLDLNESRTNSIN